ncbi:PAS domain S-box protein [Halomicrobium katesii]|uniref:PAS domain S-box protein n=1 Tax=Halomicrobium katesii TaxID=437163 RepID=UPI00037E1F05|nr:PAS domain S-box protein [Halomicrobium katesii]
MAPHHTGTSQLLHVGERETLLREASGAVDAGGGDVAVTTVGSIEAAGEQIDRGNVDCIVYEHGASGEEPESLRKLADRASATPWLFLTSDETAVDDALGAGASDVVVLREDAGRRLLSRRLEHILARERSDERDARETGAGDTETLRSDRAATDLLLDTLDDVFYLVGTDGTLERWNESLKTVTGYSDAELAEMNAIALFEESDRERVDEAVAETLETGSSSVEASFVTTDGETIPYEFTGARLADDGDVRGLVGIGRDISERKALEAELRRKASLLDHIFNQVPTALYVKDTEARHVRMSEFHSDADGTLGKTDPEIYGETEYTESTYADDMRVIEEGDRIINQEEFNPRTGEWSLTSKVPWRTEDGEIQGLIGVTRLITEKKEYEQKLNLRNRAIAEAPIGITIHDAMEPPGRIVYANDSFQSLTGYDEPALDGEDLTILAGAETEPDQLDRLDTAFHDSESRSLVALLYRRDGTPFWGRITVAPVTDDDDEVTHFVGFLQDVTETKERAEEIERRLDEFGELIAEELRTPLQRAEQSVATIADPSQQAAVENAVESIRRADKLVDDLATVHSFSVKSRDVFETASTSQSEDR